MLVARAEEMGVELAESESAAIQREWRDLALSWTGALGFRGGLPGEAIKALALDAVGSTRQSVMIVQEEMLVRGPLFAAAYPTRISQSETAARPRT